MGVEEELEGRGEEPGARPANDVFAHHPLHAYGLTKHLALGWPTLEQTFTTLAGITPHVGEYAPHLGDPV